MDLSYKNVQGGKKCRVKAKKLYYFSAEYRQI